MKQTRRILFTGCVFVITVYIIYNRSRGVTDFDFSKMPNLPMMLKDKIQSVIPENGLHRPTSSSMARSQNTSTKGSSQYAKLTTLEIVAFKYPGFGPAEREQVFTLMDHFSETTRRLNITWMMVAGTMLGSYRHHDIIPWDDDIDLSVDMAKFDLLKEAYDNIDGFTFTPGKSRQAKISLKTGRSYTKHRKPYTFPFLDLWFYNTTDSDNGTTTIQMEKYPALPRNVVLPPLLRPFGDRLYPAPRQINALMHVWGYNITECNSGFWNHMLEDFRANKITLPCSTFVGKVPWVEHRRGENGQSCVEELKFGGVLIQTFVRPAEGNYDC